MRKRVWVGVLFLLAVPFFIGTAWADLNDGLVTYYPFDGDAQDASGNSNHGTVNGATLTTDRFGNANCAYSFDGDDDYIQCPNISLPQSTQSLWFKKLGPGGPEASQRYRLISRSTKQGTLAVSEEDNEISWHYPEVAWWRTIQTIYDNQWYHVALTNDGASFKLYLNGLMIDQVDCVDCSISDEFFIGSKFDYTEEFNGAIDDVSFYNRALSEAEIRALYSDFHNESSVNTIGQTFVKIPAGTFMMGSPAGEQGQGSDESYHEVTLTKAFYIMTTEVTCEQWETVMGITAPGNNCSGEANCPVNNISWYEAHAFIDALNTLEGTSKYRLPSDAEWEYAAKAGSTTAFPNGDITELYCGIDPNLNQIGWYCGNSGNRPHGVAQKSANVWGLFDMAGNVWEWCQDWYTPDLGADPVADPIGPETGIMRVVRSGGWSSNAKGCRSADRGADEPARNIGGIGFRIAFTGNVPPIADAGVDQSIRPGDIVTLDGSASYDSDENYPLTYTWEFISIPAGSAAILSDTDTVNPSFIADVLGDYQVQLVVTDSKGLSSNPDETLVSTYNTAPVADAGLNQEIVQIGTIVSLNGTDSYDDDGDDISYSWSIISKPEGSLAELDDQYLETPSFIADVHGDFQIQLVVSDPWESSDPDTVLVSFDNVPPVAYAGDNQSAVVGYMIVLDGSGSSDANHDPLTYSWSIVSSPDGSLTELFNPSTVGPNFVPDLPGDYIIGLVVNDGLVESDPSNVTVTVISRQDAITDTLQEMQDVIHSFPDNVFKNKHRKNPLTNKINAALKMIDQGNYQDALDKLEQDILNKTNGCAEIGSPDSNDWITDCAAQAEVYTLILEAISYLNDLIQ